MSTYHRKANQVKIDLETYLKHTAPNLNLAIEDTNQLSRCGWILWLVKSPLEDHLGIQILSDNSGVFVGFVDLELGYTPRFEPLKTMADLDALKREIDGKISKIL